MNVQKPLIFNRRLLILISLFLVAFAERTLFDFGPNIELVTVTILLASAYLGRKHSIFLLLSIMILSDLVIGNSNIFIFTWSGFLIPLIIAGGFFGSNKNKKVVSGTLLGIFTTLFFFLWTNFGVWILDFQGMYSNDLTGLAQSYINALPFLKLHMTSTFLFVPVTFTVVESVRAISKSHLPRLIRNWHILPS